MPGAKTHDAITVVSGLALAPIAYPLLLNGGLSLEVSGLDTALVVGAHCLSGLMFSPDLDIDSAIDNRWGIFFWVWRPYMRIVPHHRHWLSHGLVIPPLLRLLYLFVVVILLFGGVALALAQIGVVVPDYPAQVFDALLLLARAHPREVFAFLVGFITGGAAHSLADWSVTGGKHFLHRLGFRLAQDYSNHDQRHQRQQRW
ncbi:MAG: metal-binding protein [Chloroflexi bacterium]|nr:metal-binding protein [Chloroflexota bacterium]